jgi:hypothetical protein
MEKLKYLEGLCRSWGWEITEVSSKRYDELRKTSEFYEAPFTSNLGISFQLKSIIWTDEVSWPSLVHEMAHVFATTKSMYRVNELDFLGWEYQLAITLNGVEEWLEDNRGYMLGDLDDIRKYVKCIDAINYDDFICELGQLPVKLKSEFLSSCLRSAEQRGLIINGEVQNISNR